MAINLLVEIVTPSITYALTSGPSQPEVQSFEPAGTSEMVDLFSGDFNYNIPLMDVGGYPINIAYHGGVGMDQEASWVGLGWNINPGAINRSMRGLPDDFNGDEIKKEFRTKPNITVGANSLLGGELVGFDLGKLKANLELSVGTYYNNYKGVGYEIGASPSISAGEKSTANMTLGLGLKANTQTGVDINPSLSVGLQHKQSNDNVTRGASFRVGSSYNSRSGLKGMSFGMGASSSNKLKEASASKSFSGSPLSFGTQTWVPNISMETKTVNISAQVKWGAEIVFANPYLGLEGYYSKQSLRSNSSTKKSYGYMYEHKKQDRNVLLDFNREKDRPYTENTSNLPLANHTFDIYSASGHGVSGSFRMHRGDYPVLHSDFSEVRSGGGNIGVELGVGNAAHTGVNIGVNFQKGSAGFWEQDNALLRGLGYQESTSNPVYEPAYFKKAGEFAPVDKDFFGKVGYSNVATPEITPEFRARNSLRVQNNNWDATAGSTSKPLGSKSSNVRNKRDVRNSLLYALKADEAQKFALDPNIHSNLINNYSTKNIIERAGGSDKKGHHLSELTVLGQDGMRYIYGIPAYNTKQIEKTFAVDNPGNCQTGYVDYDAGTENSMANRSGTDQFYTSVETPAYAHSYLLSAVVSDDYVDIKNDGITDDDFGTAVGINYSRVSANFKWRTPYYLNTASYAEGLKSDSKDNKGSYVYGEKEIWHVQSIESKNQVAIFTISIREDGLGVAGENGGKSTIQRSYKLDRIDLYSKQDYKKDQQNAIPIKSVHFEYDYSLCPDVHNNSGAVVTKNGVDINAAKGKLTLKKIYFTYGKSKKGKLTPYVFDYSDFNPSYNILGHDRWGNYNPVLSASCSATDPNTTNAEYPYTNQDKESTDEYSSAWSMTQVHLPSGGR